MANIAVVAANVAAVNEVQPQSGIGGEALAQGQMVYQSTTDGRWYKGDSIGTNTRYNVARMVLTPCSAAGRPVQLAVPGTEIDLGVTLTVGEPLFLSATAAGGNLCPLGDLVSTNHVIYCGIAQTASLFVLTPVAVAVKKP